MWVLACALSALEVTHFAMATQCETPKDLFSAYVPTHHVVLSQPVPLTLKKG
jgi:hypothetical protein